MSLYVTRFKVTGTGEFPVDMLRYDYCFPAEAGDAMNIGLSLARNSEANKVLDMGIGGKPYSVNLRTFHAERNSVCPTSARWETFGWKVSDVETKKGS